MSGGFWFAVNAFIVHQLKKSKVIPMISFLCDVTSCGVALTTVIELDLEWLLKLFSYNYHYNYHLWCERILTVLCYRSFPIAQMVEHGASNANIMGSIPRESESWSNVKTVTWMQCKSLWIKAFAKCINVNVML